MKGKIKMNKNKILTALMAGTMLMGSTLPVCAAVTEEHDPVSSDTVKDTEVLYKQSSTFSVVIPKTIVLDSASKDSNYTVKVYGDISSDKQVSVAPETGFLMIDQAKAGTKKADVPANVTQTETVWSSAEVTAKTVKNGNVAAPTITAGDWKGTFTFNIALNDVVAE